MFIIVNCDFIDSKKKKDFDKILEIKVNKLNNKFKENLETNINISRGDEIQFIIKFEKEFFKIIRYLRGTFYPWKIRIGMGIVQNLEITNRNSWELNGEGFFLAREALDKIKQTKSISTVVCSHKIEDETIFNIFYSFNDIILEEWKDKNWEVNQLRIEKLSNKEIIEKTNTSSSAFYDRLKRSKIEELEKNEKRILNLY